MKGSSKDSNALFIFGNSSLEGASMNNLDRISIAQSLLDAPNRETYLEIGINTGSSFIPIRAKRKWGVDPCYRLTSRRLLKYEVFSLLGIKVEKPYRMTSDTFFEEKKSMLSNYGIDVCLVDGLHTYEQALRDVLNTLSYLKPGGVILLHDCNPSSEVAALPAHGIEEIIERHIPDWNGEWSGDVWKTIVHLRSLRHDLNAFVLNCDTGIGIVTQGRAKQPLYYSEEEIRSMDYAYLGAHRETLLGLQQEDYFFEFLNTYTH